MVILKKHIIVKLTLLLSIALSLSLTPKLSEARDFKVVPGGAILVLNECVSGSVKTKTMRNECFMMIMPGDTSVQTICCDQFDKEETCVEGSWETSGIQNATGCREVVN